MKILIYGIGGFTSRYFPITREFIEKTDIDLLGFVDRRAEEYMDGYEGLRVYAPGDLVAVDFEMLYIYASEVGGSYKEIYRSLTVELKIPEKKVGNLVDLLQLAQMHYRENMPRKQSRSPKVYDCFPFFNEIEILHMRMEMLDPYVDHFVIVEMDKDHHGKDKPYNFAVHREEFAAYHDKVIYVQPSDIPMYRVGDKNKDGWVWTIEQYQRRCIVRGLDGAEPEDIIIISDCDELPRPGILKEIRENLMVPYKTVLSRYLEVGAVAMRQDYFYYFFNCHLRKRKNTTTVVKFKNMIDPQVIRDLMNCLPYIDYGGWHLTYFGGLDRVRQKIQSIVEGSDVSDGDIMDRITSARDVFGRAGEEYEMEFLQKEDITIPDLEYWIKRYPHFYYEMGQQAKQRRTKQCVAHKTWE